jgi:hypothetical protein
MHHPRFAMHVVSAPLLTAILLSAAALFAPDLATAQASPFMTGASSLQTNSRVAREYLVALPVELSTNQRLGLVRNFSQELSDRYLFAVDIAIHAPRDFPGSDPRNFHAHLLATTREITLEGLGAKTTVEWNDENRRAAGLGPAIDELLHVRQRWASATNEALRDASIEARIDHRTLQAQGIDREPRPHIPRAAFEMERHGYRSELAERIREQYQSRVDSRLQRSSAQEKPQGLEDIRRQARESWLRLRESQAEATHAPTPDRAHDDDLSR